MDAFAPPSANVEGKADASLAGPWRRWLARSIDMTWQVGSLTLVTGFIIEHTSKPLLDWSETFLGLQIVGLLLFPVSLVVDAASHGGFGNTPGKAMLGVRVLAVDGRPLTCGEHLRRNMHAWVSGFGLGIPFVNMLFWVWQYFRLTNRKPASYDASSGRRVACTRVGGFRVFAAIAAYFVLFFALSALSSQKNERIAKNWGLMKFLQDD